MYKEPNKIRNEKSKCLLGSEKETVVAGAGYGNNTSSLA